MKSLILSLTLLLFASGAALAQDASPLSDQGIGAFTTYAGGRSAGMGNAGLAMTGNGYLNRLNPATWGGLEHVQITGTYDFAGVSSTDNSLNTSSYNANGNFGGGIFALPVDRDLGISIAGGFTPFSSYGYKLASSDSVTNISGSGYGVDRTGSGGLGEAFFGGSVSPFPELSIGLMFQYAFGRTEAVTSMNFQNSAYQGSYIDNSMYLRGSGETVGITLGKFDVLTGAKFLSGITLAGYYRTRYSLVGTSETHSIYSDGFDTVFTLTAQGYIPPEYGIGVAKTFDNGLSAVLDLRTQQLSKYYDSFTPAGTLKDALFLGGGVQYLQGKDIGSLFAKRVLRAGFYYAKTQFSLPTKSGGQKQVDELFFTAGIEFPISYSASMDVGAQYGFRGLSSDFLLHERIFRLYVSFSMGETWFIRSMGD